jgi:hypothetical protein
LYAHNGPLYAQATTIVGSTFFDNDWAMKIGAAIDVDSADWITADGTAIYEIWIGEPSRFVNEMALKSNQWQFAADGSGTARLYDNQSGHYTAMPFHWELLRDGAARPQLRITRDGSNDESRIELLSRHSAGPGVLFGAVSNRQCFASVNGVVTVAECDALLQGFSKLPACAAGEELRASGCVTPTVPHIVGEPVFVAGDNARIEISFDTDMQSSYATSGSYDPKASYWKTDKRTFVIEFNHYTAGGTITLIAKDFRSTSGDAMAADYVFTFPGSDGGGGSCGGNGGTVLVTETGGNDRDALLSPNGGEIWISGSQQTVSWMNQYITGDSVDLYVLHDSPCGLLDKTNAEIGKLINQKLWYRFATQVPNTGSYSVDPAALNGGGNAYMVLVVSHSDNSKFDLSDGMFTLQPAP